MAIIESLPDGVLEDVLLRLPYVSIIESGKKVCKRWKQVVESKSFSESYKSTAKLVEKVCRHARQGQEFTYEIVDSSHGVLRWGGEGECLGSITSHINGLVISSSCAEDDRGNYLSYIGNIFSDEWKEIPSPGGYLDLQTTATFYCKGGRYKLVYWRPEDIMTLEAGQEEWRIVHSNPRWMWCTKPVVIGNSVFRVDTDGILNEYEILTGRLSSAPITSSSEEVFDIQECLDLKLTVWQDKLHLLTVSGSTREGRKGNTLGIWRLSPGDWRAVFMSKFEVERQVDYFEVKEEENDGLLHLEGHLDRQTVVSVVYDMVAKSVKDIDISSASYTKSKVVPMPVKLCFSAEQ